MRLFARGVKSHKVNREIIFPCLFFPWLQQLFSSNIFLLAITNGGCHGGITNVPFLVLQIEKKIEAFLDDPTMKRLELSPTNKLGRLVM